jgi:hypothetical protein
MQGAPGKATGNFWQKFGEGLSQLKKWLSWNDTPPGTSPLPKELEYPTPPKSVPNNLEKQDTSVILWRWRNGRSSSGQVFDVSKDSAEVWIRTNPNVEYYIR